MRISQSEGQLNGYSSENIRKYLIKERKNKMLVINKRSKVKAMLDNLQQMWIKTRVVLELIWIEVVPLLVRGKGMGELQWYKDGKLGYIGQKGSFGLTRQKIKSQKQILYIVMYEGGKQKQANQILPDDHLSVLTKKIVWFEDFTHLDDSFNNTTLFICKMNKFDQIVSFGQVQLKNNSTFIPVESLKMLMSEVEQQVMNYSEIEESIFRQEL